MEAKILITAQIRNIDIHLMQISKRSFKVVWTAIGTNVEGLLYKNYISRCKDVKFTPHNAWRLSNEATWNLRGKGPVEMKFVQTTSAFRANRRFKEMCRAAQDPRVKFEALKP